MAQFNQVAPIFEQLHPGCQLVFTFDNSQNHHARLPGGLCAKKMLKGPGGATQPLQREHTGTVYNGVEYTLWQYKVDKVTGAFVLDANGERVKEMKGMAKILTERGVDIAGMSVDAMRLVLAEHDDFKNEKEWLAQAVHDKGHDILFLPKFHCELNYIENVWAYVKSYLRRNCTFNFPALKECLPGVLLSVPIACFKRFERHCLRFMSRYMQNDLHGPILDYIMKKYKSHRRIPLLAADAIEKYRVEMVVKLEKSINKSFLSTSTLFKINGQIILIFDLRLRALYSHRAGYV